MTRALRLQRCAAPGARRGFSIIEILVASALLAIVGALLLTSLSSSIDAKEAVEKTSGRYHVVRSAMARMVDELSQAYLSKHESTVEVRRKTGFKGERQRVDFTAFGYVARVEDAKKSDQRQLTYFLDTDERTGTQSLRRREQANLDLEFDEGGRTLTLLSDVRDLELSFWDVNKSEWSEKWDAAGAEIDRLPARVRIKVTAVMDDGQEQTFITQSRLWLLAPLVF